MVSLHQMQVIGFLLLAAIHLGVFAEISEREYASMPELFHLDNFDRCMMLGENALYCKFIMQLSPLEEGYNVQIWQTIQKTNSNVKNFRHDLLRYGICVPLSCPNIAQNVTGYNDDSYLREGIGHCYASELKQLGLKGYVTQLDCITDKPLYNIDSVNIVVGVLLASFIVIVIYSTIYEGIARYKSKNDYDRIISTKHGKMVACFSIFKNWNKLMTSTNVNKSRISCIDGLRCCNAVHGVMLHSMMFSIYDIPCNPQYLEKKTEDPKAMIFGNSQHAVQIWFVISGWLLSTQLFPTFEKMSFSFSYMLRKFIHRYIRLTVSLGAVIAITATWLPHSGRGPLWDNWAGTEYRNCRKNWWTNLLYINNYYDVPNMCLMVTWYLAADTQLFLYSLIILGIVWMKKSNVYKVLGASLVIGVLIPGILTYINGYDTILRVYPASIRTSETLREWLHLGTPGHTSIGGYTIGLIGGYIFYKSKDKKVFTKTYHHLLWWVIIVLFPLAVIFSGIVLHNENYTLSPMQAAVYASLARNIYAFGVCLLIFGLTQNVGWILRDFLLARPLQFLGKLSYGVYLVHIPLIRARAGQTRSPVYLSDGVILYQAAVDIIASFIFGTILCLVVDMPTAALQELFSAPKETKRKSE